MKLIDKDKLLEELKALRENLSASPIVVIENVESLVESLEVKEDNLVIETKVEKGLAEAYINVFDKKFGNKLPKLKGIQLHDFKNFINTCEQTFNMKYFDYHATQGKLFEKLALLWAVWGKEHLSTEMKEVDLENAVEGRIDYPLIGVDFPNIYPNYKELKEYCDKNGIKDNDKVKIIIIKDVVL